MVKKQQAEVKLNQITTSQIKKQQIINTHPNVKIRLDGYVLDLCDKVHRNHYRLIA
jgi:hypothetical protein